MSLGQVSISKAASEDVPGIQEVFYQSWLAAFPNEEHGITKEDILFRNKDTRSPERIEKQRQVLRDLPEGELFLVAKAGDTVVGVCYAVRKEDRNVLQALHVLPDYQGKGIGSLLWERAGDFFDRSKKTIVRVATYNVKAIGFYESLGFFDTGVRLKQEYLRMRNGSVIPEMEMVLLSKAVIEIDEVEYLIPDTSARQIRAGKSVILIRLIDRAEREVSVAAIRQSVRMTGIVDYLK